MNASVTTTFVGMPPRPALRRDIEEAASRLLSVTPGIEALDVTVEQDEVGGCQASRLHVKVTASIPVHVDSTVSADDAASPRAASSTINGAFELLQAELEDLANFHQWIRLRHAKSAAPTTQCPPAKKFGPSPPPNG